jgi:prepilin-type N-terminal cleavage/methylation domain-containing protein
MGKRRGFALLEMLLVIVVVAVMALLLTARMARAENPGAIKQLVTFTLEKSIGTTYTFDIDKSVSGLGAKWNPIKMFNEYVSVGPFVDLNNLYLGGNVSLDVAKIVNKGKEIPVNAESVFVLKNFDVGYWFVWSSLDNFFDHPFKSDLDGVLATVVKFEW